MQIYPWYICKLQNVNFYFFTESLLNIRADVRRDHWIPVAFMPMYDSEKIKRQTRGYECDSARKMRLYYDCLRHILGLQKDKTHLKHILGL